MNKDHISKITCLLFACLLISFHGIAQSVMLDARSYPSLRNCYQEIVLDGREYNFLNTKMQFVSNGTDNDLDLANVRQFDANGDEIEFNYEEIADDKFGLRDVKVSYLDKDKKRVHKYIKTIDMYTERGHNKNWFRFMEKEAKRVEITSITFDSITNGFKIVSTSTLNLLEDHQLLTLGRPDSSKCQTYKNFHLNYINNLDGFCGFVKPKIKTHPSNLAPEREELSQSFEFGVQTMLHTLDKDCNVAEHKQDTTMSYSSEPSGCQIYKLEIRIEPCNTQSPWDCPDYVYELDIEICCRCRPDEEMDEPHIDKHGNGRPKGE
jgi:hypothetical protein